MSLKQSKREEEASVQTIVIREFKDMAGLFPSQVPVRIWKFLSDAKTKKTVSRWNKDGGFHSGKPVKIHV